MSLLEVDKQLWVGTFGGGISRFDARTRRFENLRPGPEDGLHLSNGRVTALARDRAGHVWIGTDGGGLNVWDQKTRRLYYYKRDAKQLDSLSADTIYSILVDDAGGVWIGTRGGGLDRVLESGRRAARPALRQFLRGAGPAQQHASTACAPTAPATSGSAPTSAWRASIRSTGDDPALPSAARPAGRGIQFRRALPRSQRQVVLRRRRRLQLLLPGSARVQRAAAARGAHAVPEAQFSGHRGVPEERIERLKLGHKEDVITLKFAALDYRRPAREPLRIQARRLRQRLGARRRTPRRHLHQSARRQIRVPRARQQQRRRLEHAGSRAAHRRRAFALALAARLRSAYAVLAALMLLAVWYAQQRRIARAADAASGARATGQRPHLRTGAAQSRARRRESPPRDGELHRHAHRPREPPLSDAAVPAPDRRSQGERTASRS